MKKFYILIPLVFSLIFFPFEAFAADLSCEVLDSNTKKMTCTATGATAIAHTLPSVRGAYVLDEVRLHVNVAGASGTFTAILNSPLGAIYDAKIMSYDMTTTTDVRETFPSNIMFRNYTNIEFAWVNAGTKTWTLVVNYTQP